MSLDALAEKALEIKLGAIGRLLGALPSGPRERLCAECSRIAREAARGFEDIALSGREDGQCGPSPGRRGASKIDIE